MGVNLFQYKTHGVLKKFALKVKIIAIFLAQFRKNLYLCNIVAKQTKATKICGIANGKFFVSLGTIFSWPNRKTRTQGKGFKEEEIILQPLKFLIQLWH